MPLGSDAIRARFDTMLDMAMKDEQFKAVLLLKLEHIEQMLEELSASVPLPLDKPAQTE